MNNYVNYVCCLICVHNCLQALDELCTYNARDDNISFRYCISVYVIIIKKIKIVSPLLSCYDCAASFETPNISVIKRASGTINFLG